MMENYLLNDLKLDSRTDTALDQSLELGENSIILKICDPGIYIFSISMAFIVD